MDKVLSLAYSMNANKGIYALLLGSGISYSSGILTGWGIVLDLIEKIAQMQNEDCGERPDEWYRNKYNKEPDYSELLDELGKTQSERQMILKHYFEPTEEEIEENKKVPTLAHKAIANLVKKGYIKVIITTNFDKLMERALIEVGVTPIVISNSDNLKGAVPIVHSACTIIKVHGDYMDTRIKNTINELEEYEPEMNKLLDRVLDEFGVIICGWSADWDIALRKCFERCVSHRFNTYWTTLGEPTEKAKELIQTRKADVIKIDGADSFFKDLEDKVMALEDIYRTHPLSIKVAVAMLKKYIVNPENRIKLNDMMIDECNQVCDKLNDKKFDTNNENPTVDAGKKRIEEYEAVMEKLLYLFAYGCYWGDENFKSIWMKCIEMIADTCEVRSGNEGWCSLRKYPLLLMIYVGGIASISSNRFYNLYEITNEAKIHTLYGVKSVIEEIYPWSVFSCNEKWAGEILEKADYYTPINEYLYHKLKNIFSSMLGTDTKYDINFERFECFFGLIFIDGNLEGDRFRGNNVYCLPPRYKSYYNKIDENNIFREANLKSDKWEALGVGYFKKDFNRFIDIKAKYIEYVSKVSKKYF
ncbi:SIR2 family protein [Clostridium sp. LQ25]|uniref:SIR2 family protein n=1 Tax=Clostridium sp. LQ25 TaxID=2992805 RepID=UPI0022592587|nr:SIR2 family protein [Clostridium sp. LQ25]UZT06142.1 SIR2 family protein [Clostridium sp. LQ25]